MNVKMQAEMMSRQGAMPKLIIAHEAISEKCSTRPRHDERAIISLIFNDYSRGAELSRRTRHRAPPRQSSDHLAAGDWLDMRRCLGLAARVHEGE